MRSRSLPWSLAGWLVGSALAGLCLTAGLAAAQDGGVEACPSGGLSFADVPPGHFARTDIACLNALGIVRGTSADTFSPDKPVTRAQTAAFLARLWREVRAICPESSAGFGDVSEAHFARTDISCLSGLGIVRGTSVDTFSPDRPVTRAQTAAFLARLWRKLGKACPEGSAGFADVSEGHFARADISCLSGLGIVRGTSAETFSPDRPVTRAQTAAFLARLWRATAVANGPVSGGPPPPGGPPPAGGGGGGGSPPSSNVPGRPSGLVLGPGSRQVTASWKAPAGGGAPASGYEVRYRPTGGTWAVHPHTGLSTSTVITGLTNDNEYEVRVRALNSRVNPPVYGRWTPVSAATPQDTPSSGAPAAPTGLTLTAGQQMLTAAWTPPEHTGPVITGYHLRYKVTGTSAWTTLADPVAVTVGAVTGLTNGTSYDVAVNAANGNGAGPWSARATVALSPAPAPPAAAGLTAGDQQIAASWTAPAANLSPITGYNVRYRPTGGTWATHPHTGLTTGATVTGLTNDIQYEIQVNAVNSHGTGEWSPSAKATPETPDDPCSPGWPAAPTVRTLGQTLLISIIHVPAGCGGRVSSYDFRYKAAGVSTWTTVNEPFSVIGQFTIDTGISYGVEYEVQFRGRTTQYGPGPWSPVVTATPVDGAVPAYTLAETGVEDRGQTWTVYLCGGGDWTRHDDFDTAEKYAAFLNAELTQRMSNITGGEYEPTFVAATGEMPTGKHTGGYSLFLACKVDEGRHIVFGHHSNAPYEGVAVMCGEFAFVNARTAAKTLWDRIWHVAGHEIGHTLGWYHYRNSLDPYEFMHVGSLNDPYDQGVKSGWCKGSGK